VSERGREKHVRERGGLFGQGKAKRRGMGWFFFYLFVASLVTW